MRRGPGPHRPSCAKRLRASAAEGGHSTEEIARTIQAHCSVSPLRAQRLAKGLTLIEAAEQIREFVSDLDRGPRVTVEQLRLWEAGGHQPLRSTVLVLAAFYGCSPGGWAWKTPRPSQASSSGQSPGMGNPPQLPPCPPSAKES